MYLSYHQTKMINIDDTCLDIYSQACLTSFYDNYIIELQLAILNIYGRE